MALPFLGKSKSIVGLDIGSSSVKAVEVAVKPKGKPAEATNCYIPIENSNNFSMLVHGISQMLSTGKAAYPVERTLLTTGILDAAMTSRFEKQRRLETPQLVFSYAPGPAWKQPPAPPAMTSCCRPPRNTALATSPPRTRLTTRPRRSCTE